MIENRRDNVEFNVAKLTIYTETPVPSSKITSPFKSLREWLSYLCDAEKPEKLIDNLQFCLNESLDNYMLSVDGFTDDSNSENAIVRLVSFKPVHDSFPLPKENYEGLSQHQIREQVVGEITNFMKTTKFQSSFMEKVVYIMVNFTGGGYQKLKWNTA